MSDNTLDSVRAGHKIPLYAIRADAVLIHPTLPGISITNPPPVVADSDSLHADFFVATVVPAIDWLGMLSWYGISQPRRNHIWPVRALLHIYLMLHTRKDLLAETEAQETFLFLFNNPDTSYARALESGNHAMLGFWPRIPEMLVLALSAAKEPAVPHMVNALLSICTDDLVRDEFRKHLEDAMGILARHIHNDKLADLNISRRRAGVLERAFRHGAVRAGGLSGLVPKAASSMLMREHQKQAKNYRNIIGHLSRQATTPPTTLTEPRLAPIPPQQPTPTAPSSPPVDPFDILPPALQIPPGRDFQVTVIDESGKPKRRLNAPEPKQPYNGGHKRAPDHAPAPHPFEVALYTAPTPTDQEWASGQAPAPTPTKPKKESDGGMPEEKVRQLYAEAEQRLREQGIITD